MAASEPSAASEDVEQQLKHELEALSFTADQITQILAKSDRRYMGAQVLHAKTVFDWLLGIQMNNPHGFVADRPQVLGLSLENNLIPKYEWLVGLGVQNPAKVLRHNPPMVSASFETLKTKVKWLTDHGIQNPAFAIEKCTSFFTFGTDHFETLYRWLETVNVKNPHLAISREPELLSTSIEDRLIPIFQWFVRIGIRDVPHLLETTPRVFINSLDKMKKNYQWLQTVHFDNPARIVEKMPTVLNRNLDSLKRKLSFLLETCGMELSEIEDVPILFTGSLVRMQEMTDQLFRWGLQLKDFSKPQRHLILKNLQVDQILLNLRRAGYVASNSEELLVTKEDLLTQAGIWVRIPPKTCTENLVLDKDEATTP